MCHHPYFNLDGDRDVFAHRLQIAAETYLPTGADIQPLLSVAPVAKSPFDFRNGRSFDRDVPILSHSPRLGSASIYVAETQHLCSEQLWYGTKAYDLQ